MSIWKDTAAALGSLYSLGGRSTMQLQPKHITSTFKVASWVMPLRLSLPVEAAQWAYKKFKGGMQKDVEEAAQALLTVFREELGIELVITAGYRSQAEQDKLYDQGRTRPGPVVTWSRASKHTEGRAFDLTVKGLTPNQVPRQVWYAIGEVGEALGLKWGGRWRSKKDMPHFEL
jgi:peptidoglycan L-alanyl-D-glutamate endopeptidase CwlK